MVSALCEQIEPNREAVPESVTQYVTFLLNEQIYALPMKAVSEIIRFPDVVEAPLTPDAIVGIANLRGRMLPVLELRTLFSYPEKEHDDATRVIVTHVMGSAGLVVDRVLRVVDVATAHMERPGETSETPENSFIAGFFNTDAESSRIAQLLDPEALVRAASPKGLSEVSESALEGELGRPSPSLEEEADEPDLYVIFHLQNQEYAFALSEVEEIVRVPDEITHVPCHDPHVLGVINLRGEILPLVDLAGVFGFALQTDTGNSRVVVISHHLADGGKQSVGVLVDEVREVLPGNAGICDALPSLLQQPGQNDELCSIYRFEDGRRIVSVLCVDTLFDKPSFQSALQTVEEDQPDRKMRGDAMSDEAVEHAVEDEDIAQLVIFMLGEQEYAVSIDVVQEITRLPEKLERVPKTPDFVEGVVNLRGAVLPVLDMRKRFELERIGRNDRQRIIVMNLSGNRTGFVVDSVSEVLRLPSDLIEDAPHLSTEQGRIMGKIVNLSEKNRLIHVLEPSQLLSAEEAESLVGEE